MRFLKPQKNNNKADPEYLQFICSEKQTCGIRYLTKQKKLNNG
ncbi:hypothetical protein DOY81_010810 [Sarcophaga bullata]|nr:hypothetical protein DOY81_010810 [Sarcophaga bullata]